jgi:hypothetical protein
MHKPRFGSTATAAAWNFITVSYSGTGTIPNFYTATNNAGAIYAIGGSGSIFTAPSCTVLTRTIVGSTGASFSMNDLKIYNFALTNVQVNARFSAELGKL